jgi:hypothetical protein
MVEVLLIAIHILWIKQCNNITSAWDQGGHRCPWPYALDENDELLVVRGWAQTAIPMAAEVRYEMSRFIMLDLPKCIKSIGGSRIGLANGVARWWWRIRQNETAAVRWGKRGVEARKERRGGGKWVGCWLNRAILSKTFVTDVPEHIERWKGLLGHENLSEHQWIDEWGFGTDTLSISNTYP